uniref:RHS repeat-associated core domain-containing protein n=1 Tax=uncultured Psychrobacter sp. TaxID=259303 RepID=UPI002599946B
RVGGEVLWREQVIDQIQVSQNELQPIRFQGQHFDEETGLHYNRFRYYDPGMGMFTSRDPIGLRGGDNVFQYAPNPVNWVDPLGLEPYGLGSGPYSQSNTLRQ